MANPWTRVDRGGYNSGSIGDVCWDGALAIIEQKHPRPILGCLVSQARGRCGAGASSPFLLLLFFRCAALPLRSSGLILVDTQRRQSNEECGIDPLEIDVWRSANQPTRACAAIPSVPVWANSDRGVEGGGPLAAMACAVTRVALLVRQGLVFQARSRAHEKVVVVPSVSWSWLGSGNHLQAMTSETTCAWFSDYLHSSSSTHARPSLQLLGLQHGLDWLATGLTSTISPGSVCSVPRVVSQCAAACPCNTERDRTSSFLVSRPNPSHTRLLPLRRDTVMARSFTVYSQPEPPPYVRPCLAHI